MKRMALIAASLSTALLGGCTAEFGVVDEKLRQELFFKCMQVAPAGPQSTKYNDWAELVEECGRQARYMTTKCIKNCT